MSQDRAILAVDGDLELDRAALLRPTALVAFGFAAGAAVQSSFVLSVAVPALGLVPVWARIVANVVGVLVLLAGLVVQRVQRADGALAATPPVVLASIVGALARVGVQNLLDVHSPWGGASLIELGLGAVVSMFASSVGVWAMLFSRATRARIRVAERQAMQIELALAALEDEEIRVRREVAEGLHATLQQRLVMLVARLDHLAARLTSTGGWPEDVAELRGVRDEIEQVRARDVREMSRLLYPDQLEVGVVPAIRAVLRRVPTSIATALQVDDVVRAMDDPADPRLTQAERLLAVRVVEESLTNALKHAHPRSVEVSIGHERGALVVQVTDDGGGFDQAQATPSGTARLAERLALTGGGLTVDGRPGDGTTVRAWLPLDALRRR